MMENIYFLSMLPAINLALSIGRFWAVVIDFSLLDLSFVNAFPGQTTNKLDCFVYFDSIFFFLIEVFSIRWITFASAHNHFLSPNF